MSEQRSGHPEPPMIYGYVIRVPLENLTLLELRFAAEVTRTALEADGITVGPVRTRCEQSRWVEMDGESFFMPAEVLIFREGTKDG